MDKGMDSGAGERVLYADVLRIASGCMVVVMHAAGLYTDRVTNTVTWWTANVLCSAAKFCVPVFIMLSGMFLLDPARNESIGVFLKRRLRRVGIPYLFWVAGYYAWALHVNGDRFSPAGFFTELARGSGTAHLPGHLWFLTMIMGLYLAAPVLRAAVRGGSRMLLPYFLLVCLAFCSLFPTLRHFTGLRIGLDRTLFLPPVAAFVLGYYLHRCAFEVRAGRRGVRALAILAAAATGVTAGGAFAINAGGGSFDSFFYEFWSPNVVLLSICVFLLAKTCLPRDEHPGSLRSRLRRELSACVFGVYLVHAFVIQLIHLGRLGPGLDAYLRLPLIGIPLLCAWATAISFAVVVLLRRIPVLRHVVP